MTVDFVTGPRAGCETVRIVHPPELLLIRSMRHLSALPRRLAPLLQDSFTHPQDVGEAFVCSQSIEIVSPSVYLNVNG